MTTVVHRRHRRDNRETARNHEDEFTAMERAVAVELAARPAPPAPERVPRRDRPKLPVARPAMKDPKAEIRWAAGHVGNRVAHHTFRLDLHARTFWCSAGRGVRLGALWVWDYVQMPKRQAVLARMVAEGETKKHARFSASYEQRKKKHLKKLGAAAGGVAVALAVLVLVVGPVAAGLLLFLVVPPTLAIAGRRRGPAPAKVMQLDTRPAPLANPRPSPDLIHQAFDHSGIPGIVVELAPHRVGAGWETVVRIPAGKQTFDDAVKFHGAIAGNLGISSECLFLTPIRGAGGSTKHVRIWHTTDADPFTGDPPAHPLMDPGSGPADLWNEGLPIGLDVRGSVARIAVVDTPFVLVVGQQGTGKTFLSFGIGACVGADPLWDLDTWTFKPSDSFAPLKPLVKACGGTSDYGDDQATYDRFHAYLVKLKKTMAERGQILDGLTYDENPGDKVERDVALRIRAVRPRIVLADELITPIEGDPRILPLLLEIARKARSQHIVFVASAQYADKKTFDKLQSLFGARICFKVSAHDEAETALGGGYVSGLTEPHRIPLSVKAVAFAAGTIEDDLGPRPAFKIRGFDTDRKRLAAHIARCLATVRAGQGPKVQLAKADPADPFRLKVADLFAPGETALTCMELGQRLGLGEGSWAGRRFAEQAREHGIEPQVDVGGDATGSRNATFVALGQLAEGG